MKRSWKKKKKKKQEKTYKKILDLNERGALDFNAASTGGHKF
jgi:hypothetical protein